MTSSNTVYEFGRCYFYDCTCMKVNKKQIQFKKDMARNRCDMSRKDRYLCEFAKNLVVMKECEFDIQTPTHEKYLTREALLTKIKADKLFGAIVCDAKVPDYRKVYFAEMPPDF